MFAYICFSLRSSHYLQTENKVHSHLPTNTLSHKNAKSPSKWAAFFSGKVDEIRKPLARFATRVSRSETFLFIFFLHSVSRLLLLFAFKACKAGIIQPPAILTGQARATLWFIIHYHDLRPEGQNKYLYIISRIIHAFSFT